MKIKRFILSDEQSNCYIVTIGKEAIIIDLGEYHSKVKKYIDKEELVPRAILCTHGHYDHVEGVYNFVQKYPIDVYLNKADCCFLTNKLKVKDLKNGVLKIGLFRLECIEAPGHSAGSMMFLIENNLFSGDVVFIDGIGRYDLANSCKHDLMNTLAMIKGFDDNIMVYPGHEDFDNIQKFKKSISKYV